MSWDSRKAALEAAAAVVESKIDAFVIRRPRTMCVLCGIAGILVGLAL